MGIWSPFAQVLVDFRVLTVGWLRFRQDGEAFRAQMAESSLSRPVAEVCKVLIDGWRLSLTGLVVCKAVMAEWLLLLLGTEA